MVTIRFPDREAEKKAIALLKGSFSGRVLRSGEHLVPEAALAVLTRSSIPFTAEGKATYEQLLAAVGNPLPVADLDIVGMSIAERIALAQEILDTVAAEQPHTPLSLAKREELDRRISDHSENPDEGVTWEVVEAAALARFAR